MSLQRRYDHLDLNEVEEQHSDTFDQAVFLGLVYGLQKNSRGDLRIVITVPHRYLETAMNLWNLDSNTICQVTVEKWSQAEEAKKRLGLI